MAELLPLKIYPFILVLQLFKPHIQYPHVLSDTWLKPLNIFLFLEISKAQSHQFIQKNFMS